MRTRTVPGVLALAVAGSVLTLSAATPTFWQAASQAEFLKGELRGLAIDTDGRLTLGPAIEQTADASAPAIWQLLPVGDGSLLAGTGNDGKVLRLAASGGLSTALDTAELQVHALALAPGGGFYAGTSPEGKVYRVTRDGTSSEFFDPGEKYIWALAVSRDGTVYVATGEKGTIYRVSPDGKGEVFYKTKATNVTSLVLDAEGRLLAATSSPGQVLRIDRGAQAFVLLDSPFAEVRALRLDSPGTIYAIGVSGAGESRPAERPAPTDLSSPTPIPTVSTEITITAIGDVPTGGSTGSALPTARPELRRDTAKGAVYRIAPDGMWETFWEAFDDTPYDLVPEADGGVLVATGNKGRLLRLAGDPIRVTLVARAEAQQVTSLARHADGRLHFATSNPGKVFALARTTVAEGTIESDVRDASSVAAWGTIRWRAFTPAGTAVQLLTRSGNTRTPDDTWSPWSAAYAASEGDAITSPKARYLQWKAVLRGQGASPILTSVTVAYLPRNTRPTVTGITVHPPGVAFARPFPTGDPEIAGYDSGMAEAKPPLPSGVPPPVVITSGPPLGRRLYQKGLQAFVWKADDEPGDRLRYDVFYKRQGETTWVPLRRGLWDPILTWDTTSVPDGTYTIRVLASDAASNAPERALTGERESDAFDIDNTPPAITVTGVRTEQGRVVVSFTVTDSHSPLDRVEYSLDATRWREVYPVDGISDARAERFEVILDVGADLPVTLRAVDALNNVASAVAQR
jgi:flavin-binding protein dodecin